MPHWHFTATKPDKIPNAPDWFLLMLVAGLMLVVLKVIAG